MAANDAALLVRWDCGSANNSIAVSHDGTRIASGSDDFHVRVWDLRTGDLLLGPLKGHKWRVWSVAWSQDDARLVSGSEDKTIRVWDARTGAPIGHSLKGHSSVVYSADISPNGSLIVSGSRDNTIRMWDARTNAPRGQPLLGHAKAIYSVAFSPDSALIASSSDDNTIRIWDARTGRPIGEPMQGHTGRVQSVSFSPDSARIVSGSVDRTVRVWDVHTGKVIGEPMRHTGGVLSVSFSPDSTRIVSGSADQTIRAWEAHTGAPIGESLRGHTNGVRSVTFTPDSDYIISCSWDETICVWKAPQTVPSFEMVNASMSAQEIFECLVRHGCADLTSSTHIDPASAIVASGGFGDVRRGTMDGGVTVAVKTLRVYVLQKDGKKAAKRAVREVYIWSGLRHPNVQNLLGIISLPDGFGMVSPWMEQGDLQRYISKNPRVERVPLCVQLASGVSYLHSIGMVHGDLKANNILVSDDGTLRISDFDYGILAGTSLRFSPTTRPGGGTLRWMAPELLQSEDEDEEGLTQAPITRSKETDVYALGMTMLEIITGRVPYVEYQNDGGIYRAMHKKIPPNRPKQLPASHPEANQMWSILLQCWDHDPSVRPNAASVLRMLRNPHVGAPLTSQENPPVGIMGDIYKSIKKAFTKPTPSR